jgi:hypothetical protein
MSSKRGQIVSSSNGRISSVVTLCKSWGRILQKLKDEIVITIPEDMVLITRVEYEE